MILEKQTPQKICGFYICSVGAPGGPSRSPPPLNPVLIESNYRKIGEQLTGSDLEGNVRGLFEVLCLHFPGDTEEDHKNHRSEQSVVFRPGF
jgi:hypothetical protein